MRLAVLAASLSASAWGAISAVPSPERLPGNLVIPRYESALPVDRFRRLTYRVSWIGIPAAEGTLELTRSSAPSNSWTGEVHVSTNRLVDLFFRMRDYLREDFAWGSLAPRRIYIRQQENRRHNEYRLDFDSASGLVTVIKHDRKGNETRIFRAENPVGPVSGAVMALAQPLNPGDRLLFDLFIGRRRYVLELTVVRRERVRVQLGAFDALRIVPRLLYVSDQDFRQRTRDPVIWVSADSRHLPLRVQAGLFIGYVRADLVDFSESPDAAPRPR